MNLTQSAQAEVGKGELNMQNQKPVAMRTGMGCRTVTECPLPELPLHFKTLDCCSLKAKPQDLQVAVGSCHEVWCLRSHLAPVVCPLVGHGQCGSRAHKGAAAETQEGPQTQSRRV